MEAAVKEPGLPVEIGRIDRELGKLWESSGDAKTRASLINLVIYTEDPGSLDANTALLADIASRHAFRAILILANPDAAESGARAWISAHCHLAGKGQICSEQITFQLDGENAAALPNIVFSHLDSDLPLCFWSQAEFREPPDEQLWSWVDRLIFDSRSWPRPAEQFARVRRIAALAGRELVLSDLAWTRLHAWRFALANLFDHSAALACLAKISSVRIARGRGSESTALLLAGWLAERLAWSLDGVGFAGRDGRTISLATREVEHECIASVEIAGDGFAFQLDRPPGTEIFHARLHAPGIPDSDFTLGAGREPLTDILLAELGRGGRHPLYLPSLSLIEPLLAGDAGSGATRVKN
jgi:glucose-6-phosphate dehydrogenase assembly protein OpcA